MQTKLPSANSSLMVWNARSLLSLSSLAGRNRNRFGKSEQQPQHRNLEDLVVHHKPAGASTRGRDDKPIDKTNVVGDNHSTPVPRHVLPPIVGDAVDRVG